MKPQGYIFLGLLVAYTGFTSVNPVFGPLARELGLSEVQAGLIISLAALMLALFSPFWGRRSEVMGRKPVFVIGMVGFSVGFALFAFIAQLGLQAALAFPVLLTLLILTRALLGIFFAATPTSAQAYIADTTSREERSAGIAVIGAASGLGLILGPALAGVLAGFGLVAPFYAASGLGFLAALVVWLGLPKVERPIRAETPPKLSPLDTRVWPFLLVGLIGYVCLVASQVTSGFYFLDRLQVAPERAAQLVGVALFVAGIAVALTQVLVHALKWQPLTLIRLGVPLTLASFVVLTLAATFPLLMTAFALLGLGFGFLYPGFISGATLAVGDLEQGTVAGLTGLVTGIRAMIGPLFGTALYGVGINVPYMASAGLLLLLTVFVFVDPRLRRAAGASPSVSSVAREGS